MPHAFQTVINFQLEQTDTVLLLIEATDPARDSWPPTVAMSARVSQTGGSSVADIPVPTSPLNEDMVPQDNCTVPLRTSTIAVDRLSRALTDAGSARAGTMEESAVSVVNVTASLTLEVPLAFQLAYLMAVVQSPYPMAVLKESAFPKTVIQLAFLGAVVKLASLIVALQLVEVVTTAMTMDIVTSREPINSYKRRTSQSAYH